MLESPAQPGVLEREGTGVYGTSTYTCDSLRSPTSQGELVEGSVEKEAR
jgi:hypothetical protein